MSDAPPALAALYASERAAGGVPEGDRDRIRNAVLASVGVTVAAGAASSAGAATTAATTAGGIAGKLVIVLVTLGAIGGGAALMARGTAAEAPAVTAETRSREPAASTPPSVSVPASPLAVAAPALPDAPASSRPPARRSRPSPTAVARATSSPPAVAVAAEALSDSTATEASESDVQRLARAVALSARGDAAGALVLLDGVSATSAVAEERDALRALTLAKLGRIDEACAAVTAFVTRHPQSIHRAAVEEVPCSSAR